MGLLVSISLMAIIQKVSGQDMQYQTTAAGEVWMQPNYPETTTEPYAVDNPAQVSIHPDKAP